MLTQINLVAGIVIACLIFAAVLIGLIYSIVKRKKIRLRVLYSFALALIFATVTFSLSVNEFYNYDGRAGNYTVRGRILEKNSRSGVYRIALGKLTFNGDSVSGTMMVTLENANEFYSTAQLGDIVSFDGDIRLNPLVDDNGRVDGSGYRENLKYYASVAANDLRLHGGKMNAVESILSGLQTMMNDTLGEHYGSIAFGMITGGKGNLDYDVTDYFSAASIGHILAVSGLHVGFVVALLNILLKRARREVRLICTVVLLGFYIVIAGFSASVIRASVMCIIGLLAFQFSARSDALSSLGLVFSSILLARPLYLFDVGFMMSVCSVYALILFSNSIARAICKLKIPYAISSAVAASLSAELGLAPVMIYYFGTFHPYSVLINIFMIPVLMVVFTFMLSTLILGFIPYLCYVFALSRYLLFAVDEAAKIFASFPNAELPVFGSGLVFMCYPLYFVASQFFMMPRGKIAVTAASLAMCVGVCSVNSLIYDYSHHVIAVDDAYATTSICTTKSDAFVIGAPSSLYALQKACNSYFVTDISRIYVGELNAATAEVIVKIDDEYSIDSVYAAEFDFAAFSRLEDLGINCYLVNAGDSYENVRAVEYNGEVVAYEYNNVLFAVRGKEWYELDLQSYIAVRTYSGSGDYLGLFDEGDGEYTLARGSYAFAV